MQNFLCGIFEIFFEKMNSKKFGCQITQSHRERGGRGGNYWVPGEQDYLILSQISLFWDLNGVEFLQILNFRFKISPKHLMMDFTLNRALSKKVVRDSRFYCCVRITYPGEHYGHVWFWKGFTPLGAAAT